MGRVDFADLRPAFCDALDAFLLNNLRSSRNHVSRIHSTLKDYPHSILAQNVKCSSRDLGLSIMILASYISEVTGASSQSKRPVSSTHDGFFQWIARRGACVVYLTMCTWDHHEYKHRVLLGSLSGGGEGSFLYGLPNITISWRNGL